MGIKNSDKKQEASNRLLQLKQSLHISQRILKGFDNGKLFYSYIPLVGNAKIAVLDKKGLKLLRTSRKDTIVWFTMRLNLMECLPCYT